MKADKLKPMTILGNNKMKITIGTDAVQYMTPSTLAAILEETLLAGAATFSFIKKSDGSLKTTVGTLNPRIISGILGTATKGVTEPAPNVQRYFDLQAMQFRSLDKTTLVSVIQLNA